MCGHQLLSWRGFGTTFLEILNWMLASDPLVICLSGDLLYNVHPHSSKDDLKLLTSNSLILAPCDGIYIASPDS
jgi:hypothetical protein